MKNKLMITFGMIALGLGCALIYKIAEKYNQNKSIINQRQTLPSFPFYSQDFIPFSAKQINKNIGAFTNVKVVMVSSNIPKETAAFAIDHNLNDAGFTWLYNQDYNFCKCLGKSVTPSVYNYKHKLVKQYTGEIKIEAVLKYFDNGKES